MKDIIDKHNDPTQHQRMQINTIHKYWHQEIKEDFSIVDKLTLKLLGTSHDKSISMLIFKLILRGDLKAYRVSHPKCQAVSAEELKKAITRITIDYYCIDKDDLAFYLLSNIEKLPNFWYSEEDKARYKALFKKRDMEEKSVLEQLEAAFEENKRLREQQKQDWPFMNSKDPCYSKELEAVVTLWMEHYADSDKVRFSGKTKKPLERWLKENRMALLTKENGQENTTAINRLATVVLPDAFKGGGSPD